jgi:hypothetical protein
MIYLTEVKDIETELNRFLGNFRVEDHDQSLARDLKRYALRCEVSQPPAEVVVAPARASTKKT